MLELEVEHIIWWLHKISPYFDLLVSKSLLKLRNIKIYLTFKWKAFNTQTDEHFIIQENTGGLMTASLFEYRSWIMDKLIKKLNQHKEYDYIKVYGIQYVYLNILKHNPLAGVFLCKDS